MIKRILLFSMLGLVLCPLSSPLLKERTWLRFSISLIERLDRSCISLLVQANFLFKPIGPIPFFGSKWACPGLLSLFVRYATPFLRLGSAHNCSQDVNFCPKSVFVPRGFRGYGFQMVLRFCRRPHFCWCWHLPLPRAG